jgi:electron transfer flavoprotein beta subunit
LKLIIDPEVPISIFDVDRESLKAIPPKGLPPVISPFDENALEAALRIKDKQDCKITVLSLGKSVPKPVLQKALAVGADEAIALEDERFDNLDQFCTAQALASAIKKIDDYGLIFTGRQAADWDSGLVWAGIAEFLDLPSITLARKAELKDEKVIVERVTAGGVETLESDMPLLLTFSNEVGELRHFSLSALMKVKKMEIQKWSGSDIGYDPLNIIAMKDLYIPDLGEVDCHFLQGDSPQEKGRNLAHLLIDAGIIS